MTNFFGTRDAPPDGDDPFWFYLVLAVSVTLWLIALAQ